MFRPGRWPRCCRGQGSLRSLVNMPVGLPVSAGMNDQEREDMGGVDCPGWHRGGETEVWRGGHAVRLGAWALFRHEVDGNGLELVALVEAGKDGWTWEVAVVGGSRCVAKSLLGAMGEVTASLAGTGAGRGRDERRAAVLLRRWSAGAARADAA